MERAGDGVRARRIKPNVLRLPWLDRNSLADEFLWPLGVRNALAIFANAQNMHGAALLVDKVDTLACAEGYIGLDKIVDAHINLIRRRARWSARLATCGETQYQERQQGKRKSCDLLHGAFSF